MGFLDALAHFVMPAADIGLGAKHASHAHTPAEKIQGYGGMATGGLELGMGIGGLLGIPGLSHLAHLGGAGGMLSGASTGNALGNSAAHMGAGNYIGGALAGVGGGLGLAAGISDWSGSLGGEGKNSDGANLATTLGLGAAGGIAGGLCPALAPFIAGAGLIGHVSGMGAHALEDKGHVRSAEAVSILGMAGSGAMLGAGIGSIIPAVGTAIGAGVGGGLGAVGGGMLQAFGKDSKDTSVMVGNKNHGITGEEGIGIGAMALGGAAIGSVVPLIGTAIGAGVGTIAGLIGSLWD